MASLVVIGQRIVMMVMVMALVMVTADHGLPRGHRTAHWDDGDDNGESWPWPPLHGVLCRWLPDGMRGYTA